ncbi:prefoldin subunit 4-like isoform X1 [Saccoglossus kowalevskii]|uniref:Prefoldin subunit 4 n=1 Tax=Saccoglossus kowalevskii TaxID=10224 RepID=A0ABM0GV28_SACKO|nr:PREDICTED: prefoldin subunit 4-like [Saccoglossus kowalevskii]
MAATSVQKGSMSDSSVQVTYEDQQKINKFARKNSKLSELKEDIQSKKKELQNLQDASDDLVLLDDSELVPYQIGEVFVNHSIDETQELIEKAKAGIEAEIRALEEQVTKIQALLQELKIQLYAKFGKNINLEADEE